MYYRRHVSEEFLTAFLPGGGLRFIVDACIRGLLWNGELFYDPQLRNDASSLQRLSLYVGRTRTLNISPIGSKVRFEADSEYTTQACASGVFGDHALEEIDGAFQERTLRYLQSVGIGSDWWGREGAIQNDVARRFSIEGKEQDPFLLIDREVEVGDADAAFAPIREESIRCAGDLSRRSPKEYGVDLDRKSWGAKVDALALGLNNELFLIEMKCAPGKMYLAPLQVATYMKFWTKIMSDEGRRNEFVADINRLVRQKIQLGIFPDRPALDPARLSLVPTVIIGGKFPSLASEKGYFEKYRAISEIVRRDVGFKGSLQGLRTYSFTRRTFLEECRL